MRVPIVVFGAGGVSRALLKLIVEIRGVVSDRGGCRLDVIGVVDTRSWIWEEDGLEDSEIIRRVESKRKQAIIGEERPEGAEMLSRFSAECRDIVFMIDVTAAEGMERLVDQALELGLGVVLANKKPLTGSWEQIRHFYNNPRIRFEATVSGGLPVIETLRTLLDSGDKVISISGQLSGSMSSITKQMDEGVPFSEALRIARARGITEPDPREDLDGWDAMRKLVILGRVAGWPLELSDIEVEPLTPRSLANLPLEEFMDSIKEIDGSLGEWREKAREAGLVLRYLARLEEGHGTVGLKAIQASNPIASNSMVAFQTRRYDEDPLYIGSNTSGPVTTAAAVLSDMVGLVREW